MAVIETWLNQDLQKPVKVQYIDGSLFSNNGNGNRIGVVVTDNGEPVTISGTVSGYVVVSDGSTVPCTGAKSGNRASILIPPAAYVPGSAFISLFITDGTTVTTLAAVSTTVLQTRTGTQVDPGSVVTDWTQTINGAMQDVQTAAANLGSIVATPYASLTYPVPLGKYTYYDGGLYRCISPIASSETFTPAHWTAVKLGDDVSDLKSAVSNAESNILNEANIFENIETTDYIYTFSDFEQGYRHGRTTVKVDSAYLVSKKTLLFTKGTIVSPEIGYKYYFVLADGTIYGSIASSSAVQSYTFTEDVIAYIEINKSGITEYTLAITYRSPITTTLQTVATLRNEFLRSIAIQGSFVSATDRCTLSDCTNLDKVYIQNKNLLPIMGTASATDHEITKTVNSDGSISLSGTANGTAVFAFTVTNMPPLKNGDFTLSLKNSQAFGDDVTYLQLSINGNYSADHVCRFDRVNSSISFKLSETQVVTGFRIRISSGKTCPEGFRIYPQLEEGTEETVYVKSEVYSFTPTSAQTETTCFVGYNYISAKGTMTGSVLYMLSLSYELQKIKDSGDTELSGKTIVCFGDSITGNYPPPLDYPSLLSKMTGATVYNVGFGGCCMSDNGQERRLFTMCRLVDSIVAGDFTPQSESGVSITYGGTSYNYVPDRIATLESIDWTKVDYITIAYGTNDWNSNYGLDNQSNPLDTTTYIGAFRYAIEKLLTAYPNIKVLPITPLWRWWDTNSGMPSGETGDYLDANTYAKGTGYYLWNYGNALIEAAKWYHIPVLDMYFNCMMNKQNRFQYFNTTDGTHPKLDGRILFAEILRSALESKY